MRPCQDQHLPQLRKDVELLLGERIKTELLILYQLVRKRVGYERVVADETSVDVTHPQEGSQGRLVLRRLHFLQCLEVR